MITLKQLAAECGVSIATISNIINGKSNVSEETKKKVLAKIEETGYKPNVFASRLRANKTKTIGLLIDDLGAFSSPMLIEGAISTLEAQGYKAIIETVRLYSRFHGDIDSEEYKTEVRKSIKAFEFIKVDGIIYIAAHSHNIDFLPSIISVPFVLTYSYSLKNDFIHINVDDFNSAYCMTDYLIKKGSRKIAVIGGSESIHSQIRYSGFKKAMEDNHLKHDESLFAFGNWDRRSGYECAKKLIAEKPDTFFCFNDLMAAGVYDCLYENNILPGKDVKVAGYDNREIAEYLVPPLTTMELPLIEIGQKSAEVILKKINGTETQLNSTDVLCRLVERKSV